MLITAIFLISCIITARLLDKHKLRLASAAYSVLFVVLLTALLFTIDVELVGRSISNLVGTKTYLQTREALLYALHSAGYGTCITLALLVTLFLQLLIPFLFAVATVVALFKKGKEARISKKDKYRLPHALRELYVRRRINLLYCRMLN